MYNASFTKEAASKPAAIGEDMQGTFTGNNAYSTNYTVKVNADSIEYSEVDETWGVNIKALLPNTLSKTADTLLLGLATEKITSFPAR